MFRVESVIELILFIALGIGILIAFEVRARKQEKVGRRASAGDIQATGNRQQATDGEVADSGCCGAHLVCERETLLQTNAEIVYYDDEELDELAGINPQDYTLAQHDAIADVFHTLQEKDVPGWCRSLQLRHIELPFDIREEALLIVRERRSIDKKLN